MIASNYQPNRLPILLMNTDTGSFTNPKEPDFWVVWRQCINYPFDTETATALNPDGTANNGVLTQVPKRGIDFCSPQGGGAEAPWLRAYPDPEGFGRSLCRAACWHPETGRWYIVDRRAVGTSGAFIHRLFKCGEWLDTDAVEIAAINGITSGETVKDIHCVEVQNSGSGLRTVLVLLIGRETFPTNMADWYDRLCWMEVTGGALTEFHRVSYPRVVSGSPETRRDMLWSICVGGRGNNILTSSSQSTTLPSETVYGLVDRDFYSSGEAVARQQAICSWQWNSQTQSFSGGSFGGTLLGDRSDYNANGLAPGDYWKRIFWNPYVSNGGGSVMFPLVELWQPPQYGNGSVVIKRAEIRYAAGFDNRFTAPLYKCPVGPLNSIDEEFNDVRSGVYPSQCWVGPDSKFLYVNMTGGVSSLDGNHQPRNARQIERDQLGIFAYAPTSWPNIGPNTEENHNTYRQQMTGRAGIHSTAGPDLWPERLILGPGCY